MIKSAMLAKTKLLLVISKVDRLIIELKLPPADAYFKLLHTIEQVNAVIDTIVLSDQVREFRLSPELGNVAFASAQHGWSFNLDSFAQLYAAQYPDMDHKQLAVHFWGDKYYSPQTRTFKTSIVSTFTLLCRKRF